MIRIAFYQGDIQYHVPAETYKGQVINKAMTRINVPYIAMPSQCWYVETDRIMSNKNCKEEDKTFNEYKCWIEADENEKFIIFDTVQDPETNMWHNYETHELTASELKEYMKRSIYDIKDGAKPEHIPVTLNRK